MRPQHPQTKCSWCDRIVASHLRGGDEAGPLAVDHANPKTGQPCHGSNQAGALQPPPPPTTLTLRGNIFRADEPNHNKRVYSRELLDRLALEANEKAKLGQMFGTLESPSDGRTKLADVSHKWLPKFRVEDGVLVGEAEVLDTPCGRILETMLDAKRELTMAPRGVGSVVEKDGVQVVQRDYELASFDIMLLEKAGVPMAYGISSRGTKDTTKP